MSTLGESYAYCEAEVHGSDPDRFHAALFAPARVRPSLFALYAFNLELSRAVTALREPMLGEIRLQWWREVLEELGNGVTREHPVVRALADTIATYELPMDLLAGMIDARSFDLEEAAMGPRDDFARYTAAMSGNLFALAARCLAPARAGALDAAAFAAGEAYGGAGLLKAVAFHAQRRKLFIPSDIVGESGLDPETVFTQRMTSPLRTAILYALGDVQQALKRARKELRNIRAAEALPAFLPLALVQGELLRVYNTRDAFAPPPAASPLFARQWRLLMAAVTGRP